MVLSHPSQRGRWRLLYLALVAAIVLSMMLGAIPASADGVPTPTVSQCKLADEPNPRPLSVADGGLTYGQFGNNQAARVLHSGLKTVGGDCLLEFGGPVTMAYDSGSGTLTLDGRPLPNGKGVVTGSKFRAVYGMADGSAGFVVSIRVTDAGAAPVAQPVVVQAQAAPVVQAQTTPPPAAPAPAPIGLSGSCAIGLQHFDMSVDWKHPGGALLYMDEKFVAAGKTFGPRRISCHYYTTVDATLQIAGRNDPVKAGANTVFETQGGEGFGWALKTSYTGGAAPAAPQASQPAASSGDVNFGEGLPYDGWELKGSCTVNGQTYPLRRDPWHPAGELLYMSKELVAAGESVNADIPCHLATPYGVIVKIAGEEAKLAGGRQYFFNAKGGPGFGWTAQQTR